MESKNPNSQEKENRVVVREVGVRGGEQWGEGELEEGGPRLPSSSYKGSKY